jgi:hypothetical protein
MQNAAVISFINILKSQRVQLFNEFVHKKDDLDTVVSGCVVTYPVYDVKNMYPQNLAKMPLLNSACDSIINNLITSSFNIYTEPPKQYFHTWDSSYPIKRFYLANSKDSNAVQVMYHDNLLLKGKDWNNGSPISEDDMCATIDNTYLMIDLWVGDVPMTVEQKTAYFTCMQSIHHTTIPNA